MMMPTIRWRHWMKLSMHYPERSHNSIVSRGSAPHTEVYRFGFPGDGIKLVQKEKRHHCMTPSPV